MNRPGRPVELKALPRQATRDAYGDALLELGRDHPEVVVLDADLSGSTRSSRFAAEFPERFFNVGIAEQNMVGMAAGLACAGKVPFASSFAVFITGRAFEQVRQSVADPALRVRLVGSHAGITVGEDGSSHQAIEDIALMRSLPNMTVLVPADGTATRALVKAGMDVDGPVYLRLGRAAAPLLYSAEGFGDPGFRPGGSSLLMSGTDVTVIACGVMVAPAVDAAYRGAEEGLSVGVVDAYSVKPLDRDAVLAAAARTGALVTAEEHTVVGGLGAAVAEITGEECPVPVVRVGIRDCFGQSGDPESLLRAYGLTSTDILRAIHRAAAARR